MAKFCVPSPAGLGYVLVQTGDIPDKADRGDS